MKNFLLLSAMLLLVASSHAQTAMTPTLNFKSRVIKTSFFAPLFQHIEFGYEQSLNNKAVFDGSIGIIGPGVAGNSNFNASGYQNSRGLYIKSGVKFFFNPDYVVEGEKRFNDFQGTYFEPQLIIGGFSYSREEWQYDPITYTGVSHSVRSSDTNWSFSLNIGKEYVLANMVSLNMYGGLGYGGSSVDYDAYKFSHVGGGSDFPITATGGFTIGLLMK